MRRPPPLHQAAAALLLGGVGAAQTDAGGDDLLYRTRIAPYLEAHCTGCHGGQDPRADLDLGLYPDAASARADAETWDLLRELLAHGEMPPSGEPRPPRADTLAVLTWIDDAIGPPAADGPVDPGPSPLRRLNRTEYRNTVRDLCGVDFPVDEFFPPDPLGHGFDTSVEAQSIPELLMERYVQAAERIAAQAIVLDDSAAPKVHRFDGAALRGPNRKGGAVGLWKPGEAWAEAVLPRAGRYAVRARAWADSAGDEPARMELRAGGEVIDTVDVLATRDSAGHFEAVAEVSQSRVRVAAAFVNDFYEPDRAPGERDRNLFVEWIEVMGPLDPPTPTPFQAEVLSRYGAELGKHRLPRILEHLVLRAWRRPAVATELRRLQNVSSPEDPIAVRLRAALAAILASPNFLFRVELDPPPSRATPVRDLDSWELAARLSYLLWSTTPDEELLALAASGRLVEEPVLLAQTDRLLADPRSRAFSASFAEQWLQVRRLAEAQPDPGRFPDFDEELRASMLAEPADFFDAVLRGGESVWALLEADWTVANARLAEHYGVAPPIEEGALRVSLAETPRRGVLGQAGVLTATSHATRTSPVKRGKWILEVLLGTNPPPPPPGADSLADEEEEHPGLSFREKLALHREDPTCASCHATMDPLGFGLENFDAIGRFRASRDGHPVDARGELPDGRTFDGPVDLAALLRDEGRFVRALVEKVLVYALGRGLVRSDRRTVDGILARLDPELPALSQIVREVIRSDAFRRRRGDTR